MKHTTWRWGLVLGGCLALTGCELWPTWSDNPEGAPITRDLETADDPNATGLSAP